jgi:hypothetical protein
MVTLQLLPIEELEKEKKQNLKDEKRKKKKKAKKQLQSKPRNLTTEKAQNNCNEIQRESNAPKDPSEAFEEEEHLVGYGTNAMIYNNNAGESDSSEDEGIEDYKINGYPPVHIG